MLTSLFCWDILKQTEKNQVIFLWCRSHSWPHITLQLPIRARIHESDAEAVVRLSQSSVNCGVSRPANYEILWILFALLCLFPGWRLGCRTYKEEETGRSLLCADVTYRGCLEKDAPHRPQHVLSCRSGTYQLGQDQIFFGSFLSDFEIIWWTAFFWFETCHISLV